MCVQISRVFLPRQAVNLACDFNHPGAVQTGVLEPMLAHAFEPGHIRYGVLQYLVGRVGVSSQLLVPLPANQQQTSLKETVILH